MADSAANNSSMGGKRVEITGWLVGAKIVRGILNIVIETLDDSGKRKRKRYKVRSGRVAEQELREWLNTAVRLTIIGGMVDDIFPS